MEKEKIELSGIKVSKETGAWLKILIAANAFYEQVSDEMQDLTNEGESYLDFDRVFKPTLDFIEGKIIGNIHERVTFPDIPQMDEGIII